MSCPNCTEDEFCSDACMYADEPCLHGDLGPIIVRTSVSELRRCLDCGMPVRVVEVRR